MNTTKSPPGSLSLVQSLRLPAVLGLSLVALVGCSNNPGLRTGSTSNKIKTYLAVGDKPLPVVSGEPGATLTADDDAGSSAVRRPSNLNQGRISGRVYDSEGRPVRGASVRLATGVAPAGRDVRVTTDDSGAFTLHDLRKGSTYTLIAEWEGADGPQSGRIQARTAETGVRIGLMADEPAAVRASAPSRINRVSEKVPVDSASDDSVDPEFEGADLPAALPAGSSSASVNEEDLPPAPEAEAIRNTPITRKISAPRGSSITPWRAPDALRRTSTDAEGEFDRPSSYGSEVPAYQQDPTESDRDPLPSSRATRKRSAVVEEPESPYDEGPNPLPPAIEPPGTSQPRPRPSRPAAPVEPEGPVSRRPSPAPAISDPFEEAPARIARTTPRRGSSGTRADRSARSAPAPAPRSPAAEERSPGALVAGPETYAPLVLDDDPPAATQGPGRLPPKAQAPPPAPPRRGAPPERNRAAEEPAEESAIPPVEEAPSTPLSRSAPEPEPEDPAKLLADAEVPKAPAETLAESLVSTKPQSAETESTSGLPPLAEAAPVNEPASVDRPSPEIPSSPEPAAAPAEAVVSSPSSEEPIITPLRDAWPRRRPLSPPLGTTANLVSAAHASSPNLPSFAAPSLTQPSPPATPALASAAPTDPGPDLSRIFESPEKAAEVSGRRRPTWGEVASRETNPPPLDGVQKASASALALAAANPSTATPTSTPPRVTAEPKGALVASRNRSASAKVGPTEPSCDYDERLRRLNDFQLPDLQGQTFRFKDVDADLVLLDFWGTWCQPCIKSIPHLVDLQAKIEGKRLAVVGIACEQDAPGQSSRRVSTVANRLKVNYPVLLSRNDGSCPLQEALHIQAYPTMILLDRQGRVLWRDHGATPATLSRLDRMIATATQNADARVLR